MSPAIPHLKPNSTQAAQLSLWQHMMAPGCFPLTFEAIEQQALAVASGWSVVGPEELVPFARRVFGMRARWESAEAFLRVLDAAAACTAHAGCAGFTCCKPLLLLGNVTSERITPDLIKPLVKMGFITLQSYPQGIGVPDWATEHFYGHSYIVAMRPAL